MVTKRDWFWIIVSLLLTWGLDRYTKVEALTLVGVKSFGALNLSLQYNPGAILGLFSQLPPVLRVVTLSTGGAFLIFTFLILQYLIPVRALSLRIGMSLLLGGIIGNVTDRIAWGHVVDFISFRFGTWASPIFNVADAVQWAGHFLVMFSLIRHADLFWPETNSRKTRWVNLRFQLKYCFILMTVGLGMGAVAGTLSYTYLRVTLLTVTGDNHALLQQYLVPFMISLIAVNGIFIGILFLIGKVISLRVAGPVFAFEKYVDDLLNGKFRDFKVRRSDEFQHLNEIGVKLKVHLEATIPPNLDLTPPPLGSVEVDTKNQLANETSQNHIDLTKEANGPTINSGTNSDDPPKSGELTGKNRENKGGRSA
jgi:signal peptidase II